MRECPPIETRPGPWADATDGIDAFVAFSRRDGDTLALPPGLDDETGGALSAAAERGLLKGKPLELWQAPTAIEGKDLVVVGLGGGEPGWAEAVRRAAGAGVARLNTGSRSRSVGLLLPTELPEGAPGAARVAAAAAEGAGLGAYEYLAQKSRPREVGIARIVLLRAGPGADSAATQAAAATAGAWYARDLGNTPANQATPEALVEEARQLASRHDTVTLKVLDAADCEAEGMGALCAVARGSAGGPRLVAFCYTGPGAEGQRAVAVVGKGVTFDSGGYNLKTGPGIASMKYDKCGGMAVYGMIHALGLLRIPVRVVGIVPLAENMIDENAIHPGDCITTRSGKTVEINNTDAEGRLILADALDYAKEWDPEQVVDLATLTGSASVALGRHMAALFCNDAPLRQALQAASAASGEAVWHMPLIREHSVEMKSQVADLKNAGSRLGGASTGAAFLQAFAPTSAWAHIDIAPVSNMDKPRHHWRHGATGFGVRLLLAWLQARI